MTVTVFGYKCGNCGRPLKTASLRDSIIHLKWIPPTFCDGCGQPLNPNPISERDLNKLGSTPPTKTREQLITTARSTRDALNQMPTAQAQLDSMRKKRRHRKYKRKVNKPKTRKKRKRRKPPVVETITPSDNVTVVPIPILKSDNFKMIFERSSKV